jgi:hypothetical protein
MIPLVIYAHRDTQGCFTYVGATTNLKKRWPSAIVCVVLETTTLSKQVERETFWIQKLREEGHPLRNRVSPGRMRLRYPPPDRGPTPHFNRPNSKEAKEYRVRAHRRRLIVNAEWYRENGQGAEVDSALKFLNEDRHYWRCIHPGVEPAF